MDETKGGLDPQENSEEPDGASRAGHKAVDGEKLQTRGGRATLIEQTTYQLMDLFTIIGGRIEILSEWVPHKYRDELLAIRKELEKGVELNKRFHMAAKACQRDVDN